MKKVIIALTNEESLVRNPPISKFKDSSIVWVLVPPSVDLHDATSSTVSICGDSRNIMIAPTGIETLPDGMSNTLMESVYGHFQRENQTVH